MKRPIYRKWYNSDELSDNYLLIHPSGIMLQITFESDGYLGEKVLIYQTKPGNPLNHKVYTKVKEVCSKKEWAAAQIRATHYIKGKMLPKSASNTKLKGRKTK